MSRPRYWRAKPVIVEAVQWTGVFPELPAEWRALDFIVWNREDGTATVRTLEGLSTARVGDYIVRGTAAEFYPVRRAIFREKYEPVEDPDWDDPAEDAAFEAAHEETLAALRRAVSEQKDQP